MGKTILKTLDKIFNLILLVLVLKVILESNSNFEMVSMTLLYEIYLNTERLGGDYY